MEQDSSSETWDDVDCLAALHEGAIVACYEDLPGWMFVFTRGADGECEVTVYDRDRRQCLSARGDEMEVIMGELRSRASQGVFTF